MSYVIICKGFARDLPCNFEGQYLEWYRPNDPADKPLAKLVQKAARKLTEQLAAEGRLIEGGWQAFALLFIPEGAHEQQTHDMRIGFYAGAEHLWYSIMSILQDETDEPTDKDMDRLDKIQKEVEAFREQLDTKWKGYKHGET